MHLLQALRAYTHRSLDLTKEEWKHRQSPAQPATVPNRDVAAWNRTEQAEGPFWTLPPELRSLILLMAFGGRTVHIDLRMRPPLLDKDSSGREPGHGGYPPLMKASSSRKGFAFLRRDRDVAWRWYHCVCHRHVAWDGAEIPPGYFLNDRCLEGEALCLGELTRSSYDACQLGVMGFLLSCKQSHDELLPVLYCSNTISTQSLRLISALASPINPELGFYGPGMNLITSLELQLDLEMFHDKRQTKECDVTYFQSLLRCLESGSLAALRHLNIILEESLYTSRHHPWKRIASIHQGLLLPLLKTRRHLALPSMNVAVPLEFYKALAGGFAKGPDSGPPPNYDVFQNLGLWNRRMRYPYMYNWDLDKECCHDWYWLQCGVVSDQTWTDDPS